MNMRRPLTMLLLSCTLVLLPQIGAAASCPPYWNGNPHITLAAEYAGTGYYVDNTSVIYEFYSPSYYRLAATIFSHRITPSEFYFRPVTEYFDYYVDSHKIYKVNRNGSRRGPLLNGKSAGDSLDLAVAKSIWKAAYKQAW